MRRSSFFKDGEFKIVFDGECLFEINIKLQLQGQKLEVQWNISTGTVHIVGFLNLWSMYNKKFFIYWSSWKNRFNCKSTSIYSEQEGVLDIRLDQYWISSSVSGCKCKRNSDVEIVWLTIPCIVIFSENLCIKFVTVVSPTEISVLVSIQSAYLPVTLLF